MKKSKNILVPFILILFASCNKEERIPAYIHIDKIALITAYANVGSNSNKIVDAWIYIDGQLAGTYELPCTIPVLYEGSHSVMVLPGIKENGISETRIPYPFYDKYEETVTFVPGQITTISPTTVYSQGADFSWLEDFEGSHGICDNVGTPDTIMSIIHPPEDVFEMSGSGAVVLAAGHTSYFGITCNKYVLPQAGAPVFLELNYKCNTDLNVGIVGYSGTTIDVQSISLTLRPTSGWNKVYINLTTEVTNATNSTQFAIFFSMLKNPDLTTSYFYLDNVKLIN
jgi:hypothetical protein